MLYEVITHALVALILVSMLAGLMTGMTPAQIADTIQKGMGGTLGFVAVVVALGAMFGKVMEETGALDRIAQTLLRRITSYNVCYTKLLRFGQWLPAEPAIVQQRLAQVILHAAEHRGGVQVQQAALGQLVV